MIVHRLLDAFFRTLDTIDAVRDRVDRALGREPRPDPWAVEWPPPASDHPTDPVSGYGGNGVRQDYVPGADEQGAEEPPRRTTAEAPTPAAKADKKSKPSSTSTSPAKSAKAEKAEKAERAEKAEKSAKAEKADAKKKPGRKKKSSSKRKGSVDKVGRDLASERADQVTESLRAAKRPVVTEEADLAGKKVLARVVWALSEARAAGLSDGLTTNDISALLSQAAGIEVFATNIGRACRDHHDLIAEGAADGRSKRYVLTPAGEKAATELATAPHAA